MKSLLLCCFIALSVATFTNPYCTFKGIQCSDEDGVIVKDMCTDYYTTCYGQKKIVVHKTRHNYQCYNGRIMRSNKCLSGFYDDDSCSFEGIQCVTKEGVITNEQSYYYQQCENKVLAPVQHTPTGYYCAANKLVYSGVCPECSFTGIKCVDSLGDITTSACTDRYVMCDNGKQTAPMPVAPGTQCYDGEQVLKSVCPGRTAGCNFEGIKCVDSAGFQVNNACTDNYILCDNGEASPLRPVAKGTKCYNGEQIQESECNNTECSFQGIRCVNTEGVIVADTCTSQFVECNADGTYTKPTTVAEGTMCRNNAIVPKDSCNSEQCVKDAVFCVDKSNTIVVDTCTDHFIQCQDGGAYSEPMPVAEGTQCYNGEIVNRNQCTAAECSFDGIKCVDTDGSISLNVCTSRYIMCDNGKYTEPSPVAAGTQCYNGKQILPSECPNTSGCTFEGIKCVDDNNSIVADTCTNKYVMCIDGEYSNPMPVAAGTMCYNDQQIMASECTGAECSFEGIKCIDNDGVIVTDTCTSRYVMCDNGKYSIARPIAEGTQCLNGEEVLLSECSAAECSFTGIRCIDSNGATVTDSCTDRYLTCVDGKFSDPMPVADGTMCLNGVMVLTDTCSKNCNYEGLKCVDADSQIVTGICTDRYVQCTEGIQTCPIYTPTGYSCKSGSLIASSECSVKECDFTGIKCVSTDNSIVSNICTTRYVECDENGNLTVPQPVAEGTMCLNGEQVHTEDCPTDTCVPGDIKCVNAEGQIITDECTGYFVGCTTEGVYTSPLQVAPGAKCYNGDQILESSCNTGSCSYTGIICVDSNGVLVNDRCTAHFAECVDGNSLVQNMPEGSLCYKGEFVLSSECTACTTVNGLRGKAKEGSLCYEVKAN